MANQKISQMPSLTASELAAGDLLAVVDVSDVTQASSGSNKKITVTELQSAAVSAGTANGVLYLNGSKQATSGSALTFDGSVLGVEAELEVKSAANLLFLNSDNTNYMYLNNPAGSGAGIGQLAFTLGGVGEQMRLTSTGLGIGTSSPARALDVNGAVRISNGAPIEWGGTDYAIVGDTGGALIFRTAGSERVRIDGSGNFLVGTTSSSSIAAGGVVLGNLSNAIGGAVSGGILTKSGVTTTSYVGLFSNPNGAVGSITVAGATTAYNTSSDYRLKTITGPITNSGAYIDSLNPVEGTWKADGSTFVGLIAHEVQEVSRTQVATGEKDGAEMQAMDYSNSELIANLIAEVKSLRARVAALESN